MPVDPSIFERNRASTNRIRTMARLNDADLRTPVGEHWTVSVVLVHLAFWDRRVMFVLDKTERDGKLFIPNIDTVANDLSLPFWLAIPPREAARLAVETAEALDARIEAYPPALLDQVYAYNKRWVDRSLHRNGHLDEADAALQPHR